MKKRLLKIGMLLALVLVVAFAGNAVYNYLYPVKMENTIYVEVSERSSLERLQELEKTGGKQVFVYFSDYNPIPFHFMGRGETRRKNLTINGVYEFPVLVSVSLSGNITSWVDVVPNSFELRPGENRSVSIGLKIPEDAVPGNYTEKLTIRTRRLLS